jgi:hypothetical protein
LEQFQVVFVEPETSRNDDLPLHATRGESLLQLPSQKSNLAASSTNVSSNAVTNAASAFPLHTHLWGICLDFNFMPARKQQGKITDRVSYLYGAMPRVGRRE